MYGAAVIRDVILAANIMASQCRSPAQLSMRRISVAMLMTRNDSSPWQLLASGAGVMAAGMRNRNHRRIFNSSVAYA